MLRVLFDPLLADRVANFFVRHSGATIAAILAVTGLLLIPLFLMQPTEQASQEPGGPVFELRDKLNAQFPPQLHIASFIVEDQGRRRTAASSSLGVVPQRRGAASVRHGASPV